MKFIKLAVAAVALTCAALSLPLVEAGRQSP